MTFFSNILLYQVVDQHGEAAQISDLALDVKVDPYPPVTHILLQNNISEQLCLSWQMVNDIDREKRQINIDNIRKSTTVDQNWSKNVTLLKRNILDGLMLNLSDRTSMIANDLWLEQEGSLLQLCSIDISYWAILRRLSKGMLAGDSHSRMIDWKYIEFLRGDFDAACDGRNYRA